MSKLTESLLGEMKAAFGPVFGEAIPQSGNLREEVTAALMERPKFPTFADAAADDPEAGERVLARGAPSGPKFAASRKNAEKDTAAFDTKLGNDAEDGGRGGGGGGGGGGRFSKHLADLEKIAKGRPQQGVGHSRHERPIPNPSASTKHNPFKHAPHLGKGPLNTTMDEKQCWKCKCGNIYSKGCVCVGTGKDKTCKEGHVKHVKIDPAYRKMYNDGYHEWRKRHKKAIEARLGISKGDKGSRDAEQHFTRER